MNSPMENPSNKANHQGSGLGSDPSDPAKPDTSTGTDPEQEHPAKPLQIPDTQTLWDNKCLLFEMATSGVTCYTAMDNLYT